MNDKKAGNKKKDKILFVDDEQLILEGIQRDLFETEYDLSTATSGEEGLQKLEHEGPFAVIISDMRMPGMDGIAFLAQVKEKFPESVRVMLTGNADLKTAGAAINEGNIFQFLTKPCSVDMLIKVLDAALKQYHLMQAERDLLENTLQGGIDVLVDILALTNPVAFSRATRIKYFAGQLARALNLQDVWQYEVAALLSQIGCVTIPPDILEKVYTQQDLSPDEKRMLKKYPVIGHDLIAHIPRLEAVAQIIADQHKDYQPAETAEVAPAHIGAAIVRLAIDFDSLVSRGLSRGEIFKELGKNEKAYHPELFSALKKVKIPELKKAVDMTKIEDLRKGMIIEADIQTKKGLLLIKRGQEVSDTMRVMLENHLKQGNIKDSVLTSVPTSVIDGEATEGGDRRSQP